MSDAIKNVLTASLNKIFPSFLSFLFIIIIIIIIITFIYLFIFYFILFFVMRMSYLFLFLFDFVLTEAMVRFFIVGSCCFSAREGVINSSVN